MNGGGIKHFMLEYDFLKILDNYISIYKEYFIPVVICDASFRVYWSNSPAKTLYPHLTEPHDRGILLLLMEFDRDELLTRLKTEGTLRIDGTPAFSETRLNLIPVIDNGDVAGVIILLVGTSDVPSGAALQSSMTPRALEKVIRQNVEDIFKTMDATALKADILESGWVKTGFTSIAKSSYHILRTATNISAYADFQSHPPVLSARLTDAFELLRSCESAACGIASDMGIPLRFNFPEQYAFIGIDPDKFLLAFFNILHNSLYFTRPGNEVDVSGASGGDKSVLIVTDRGMGISGEARPHIFRAYYSRGHDGKPAGIGLGLTLARILIEAHGGGISLESAENEGTRVTITLPKRTFSRPSPFYQSVKPYSADRFSPVYVGLFDAANTPYNQSEED